MKVIFGITINDKAIDRDLFKILIDFINNKLFEIKPDYLFFKEYIENVYEKYINYYEYLIKRMETIDQLINNCKTRNIDPIIFILYQKDKFIEKFKLTFDKEDLKEIGLLESNQNYYYLLIKFLPDQAKKLGLTFDIIQQKLNLARKDITFYINFKKIILNEVTIAVTQQDTENILNYIIDKFPKERLGFENPRGDYEWVKPIAGPSYNIFVYYEPSFRDEFIKAIKYIKNSRFP
jgi:hypothetical protein